MGRAASILLLVAIAACTGSGQKPAAAPTPSSAASPSAVASPSASAASSASPSPIPSTTPVPDLQLSAVSFSCRLPVLITTQYDDGASIQGGFVTFPAASYQADPNGVILPQPTGEYVTKASPVLRASDGGAAFYDLVAKRWLPLGAGQTSPDGTSYAYISVTGASNPTQVHIVQVASGADRVISIAPPPTGVGWQVEDFDGKSVYLSIQIPDEFPTAVWRLDAVTSSLQQLLPTSAGNVQLVTNGVAWVGLLNPGDPSPPQLPKGEPFNTLVSIDLGTGASTTWVYRPGQAVMFVYLDSSSHPLVTVLPPPFDLPVPLVLVPSPGNAGVAIPAPFYQVYVAQADTGRLWFGGARGVYYWTLATGLIKVYSFQGGASQGIQPAGHCV